MSVMQHLAFSVVVDIIVSNNRKPSTFLQPRSLLTNLICHVPVVQTAEVTRKRLEKNRCIGVTPLTMFGAEDGERIPQLPEEVHEGEPDHTSKKQLLSLHCNIHNKVKL